VTERDKQTKHLAREATLDVVDVVRLLLFVLYFLSAILRFWLWVFTAALTALRVLIHVATLPLSLLAGARPPPRRPAAAAAEGSPTSLRTGLRDELRRALAPLLVQLAVVGDVLRAFGHYTVMRKVLALQMTVLFVGIPGMYFVPRTQDVQILDNNVLNYQDSKIGQSDAGYLVHGADMDDPGVVRVYMNENAWWLAKINSQGLKARLVPGRYYRLQVVGLRWWYAPALYPNIISATELDAQGHELSQPSVFLPSATTGR
jgi:hypothetical protein